MVRRARPCIYCGSTDNPAPDHVPPRSIFPKPRPNDLITVPSCLRCNKSFEKDDEYFKTSLALRADIEHAPGVRTLVDEVSRAWKREESKGFTTFVHSTLRNRPIIDAGGKEIGHITGQEIDSRRIGPVVARIARGLYYNEYQTPLPSSYRVRGVLYDALDEPYRRGLETALLGSIPTSIGNGA